MTVQNVIDLAKGGELSNLAVKDDITSILGYINLGMIELYKRFPIKVNEYLLPLVDGTATYTMPSDFMWLVAAYGEVAEDSTDAVNVLPINEEDNPLSINTISWNTIQVPLSSTGSYISLIYIAGPTYLTEADLNGQIELPSQLIEALLHYVGYRAHGAINGEVQAENSTHYQRFEKSCDNVITNGMFTSDDLDMKSRDMRGFV